MSSPRKVHDAIVYKQNDTAGSKCTITSTTKSGKSFDSEAIGWLIGDSEYHEGAYGMDHRMYS